MTPVSDRAAVLASRESSPSVFARLLVDWQQEHGRHHLPWQNTRDPYRVWLSEIMLQQTQVSTVIEYYARFLNRFPDVESLASASQDEVLGLWSGLGYYSRARNLHQCAQDVVRLHGGRFPSTAVQLQTLPGIGPSTAAAVAAFCHGERVAILDGNVKRVLTRVLGFGGDLAEGRQVQLLWEEARRLLPHTELDIEMPRYTQGLMDLGSTVCVRRKPQCCDCPVRTLCVGFSEGEPEKYPLKTRKLKRSAQQVSLLWVQKPDGSVWLERRPASGIWGGLYCFPVLGSEDAVKALVPPRLQSQIEPLGTFTHVLTHKDLHVTPVHVSLRAEDVWTPGMEAASSDKVQPKGAWFHPEQWTLMGLPAPIRSLLGGQQGHQRSLRLNF